MMTITYGFRGIDFPIWRCPSFSSYLEDDPEQVRGSADRPNNNVREITMKFISANSSEHFFED